MSESLGSTIKGLREGQKLSKSRLAREAGISDAYVIQIERGDRSPSREVLRRLAHVLRVPPYRLLVAGGFYTAPQIKDAEKTAKRMLQSLKGLHAKLPPDALDRYLAHQYDVIDEMETLTTEEVALRQTSAMDLPPERYWGWDQKLPTYPPEHWETLSDADRRLVQRLVNRLAQVEDSED
jgi:transcriptional regulator with XRE-family HTH domain